MANDAGANVSEGSVDDGQTSSQAEIAEINAEQSQATATDRRNDPEDPATGAINPRTAPAKMRAAQVATTAAIGAGFEFTPEQVEAQLGHCRDQISDLQVDLQTAQNAVQAVHPPAPDQASVAQADAVREMLTNTASVLRADIEYLTNWHTKLTQAKAGYVSTEHLTEEQWARLTKGLSA